MMDEIKERYEIELVVDYLYHELDAFEIAMYLLFLRKTIFSTGKNQIRLGKRTLQSEFVHGTRGGGKANAGGIWVNYAHITKILNNLEKKGCIKISDTTREGTLYTIIEPEKIPLVQAIISSSKTTKESPPEDYFHDMNKRKEIFERDEWRCQYCGDSLNENNATLDHFIPQSIGGSHEKSNLRTCCLSCNSIKSGKSFEEVAPKLLESAAERRKMKRNHIT